MKVAGKMMTAGLIISLIAILLKILTIEGSGLLFTIAMLFLSILAFVQFFLFLINIQNNKFLKVMGALISYSFSIMFVALLFRFQWWMGYHFMLATGTILLVILSAIFFFNRSRVMEEGHRKTIRTNLILPWCFVGLFTFLHYILPDETFYNTFDSLRNEMTYQEFVDERINFDEQAVKSKVHAPD